MTMDELLEMRKNKSNKSYKSNNGTGGNREDCADIVAGVMLLVSVAGICGMFIGRVML